MEGLNVTAHACSPNNVRGRDKRIEILGQLGKKVSETFSQKQAACGGTYL
jgi:hypothetical protein